MKRVLALLFVFPVLVWPALACAQSTQVDPADLRIEVQLERPEIIPHVGELVMITIKGSYRRHITREALVQPDLDGFSWSQLGPDDWHEERVNGQTVKVFRRRMALYPTRAGTLTIDPFLHNLTLTDESDDWFEHQIQSEPIHVTVAPIPAEAEGAWWFPVRRLQISDEWSNAPDQLQPGKGVLRIIRIEALGATPEMIPPMPELTSPSAMIFAHPEKRLVELSPYGPVTYAFWRWTIRPSNDVSTILEPLELSYFNTETRQLAVAQITPQRVAYQLGAEVEARLAPDQRPAELPDWRVGLTALAVFCATLVALLIQRRFDGPGAWRQIPWLNPDRRALRRAGRAEDAAAARRALSALTGAGGASPAGVELQQTLDQALFGTGAAPVDVGRAVTQYLRRTSGG